MVNQCARNPRRTGQPVFALTQQSPFLLMLHSINDILLRTVNKRTTTNSGNPPRL